MLRALIVSSLVLVGALSGCLADEPKPASTSESTSPSDGGNSTASPSATNATVAPADNVPPTANLSSDVANGTAPLNVTFTVDGADKDGDALNWTLDADGDGTADYNGTALPSEVVHEYLEAGNYTAVLNVTDGEHFAESNVTLVVEGGAAFVPKEDDWATWDELGQCHAKDAIEIPGAGLYLHERGDPPGTGQLSGGTWIYEESNGVDGMQLGGAGESAAYVDCVNPDTLIF